MSKKAVLRSSILFLFLFAALALQAQVSTTAIFGTVSDPSGAVMPGVEVTATNLATNFSRSATTDPQGQYLIQFLPVGEYRVEAKAQGFNSFSQTGLAI